MKPLSTQQSGSGLCFCLVVLAMQGPIRGGHTLLLRADNAKLMFKHSARRSRGSMMWESLLAISNTKYTVVQMLINHIRGIHNDKATVHDSGGACVTIPWATIGSGPLQDSQMAVSGSRGTC